MNASPKGSPVLGPCYLPALPQATPFPEPGAPRGGFVFEKGNMDELKDKD